MKCFNFALRILVLLIGTLSVSQTILAQPGPRQRNSPAKASVVESGKLHFFNMKQPAGEESYEMTRDGAVLTLRSRLEMEAEEQKVSLTATLVMQQNFTPERFEIKGTKPSGSDIDVTVTVRPGAATVTENGRTRQATVSARFFAAAGYAPIAIEMMLLRYWRSNRVKGPLKILPGGEVTIEDRGRDVVTVDSKRTQLERYNLRGLTWGTQTLWLDVDGKLIAAVGIGGDIESTLPVVREGFQTALPFFLRRAAEDAVESQTAAATRLSPRRNQPVAIVGSTLIDGTGRAQVADSVVIIQGDRILAAGSRSEVNVPANAMVVDGRGKFLVPGLWDMHAHLFQAEFGPAYLASGVTTVRDASNEFEFVTVLRDSSRKGLGLGPWMLLAGYIDGASERRAFDIQVGTPDEARAAVARYKNAGFEQIKIRDNITADMLKVIADEAHRLGMTLTGHVPRAMNAIQAVEAGQDQISHINFLTPLFEFKRSPSGGPVVDLAAPKTKQAIELLKQRGTVLDPTLAYMEMFVRTKEKAIVSFEPGFAKLPSEYAEHLNNKFFTQGGADRARNTLAAFLSLVGALHQAGIPIVAGTDVVVPGHSLHRELELFVQAGFTPMEAIQAATTVPARAMKLDKEVGTIEAGKRADVIILDGNPLESISNLRKVRSVMTRGLLFDCAQLRQVAGFQP